MRAARCEACGAAARNVLWRAGLTCPNCGSDQYARVSESCESLDYETADRSHGYALEDIRFGKIAQWGGLITTKQYALALKRQEQTTDANGMRPRLGDVLVRDRVLTKKQVRAALRVRGRRRPDKSDGEFAQLAVGTGQLTREQAEKCAELQGKLAAEGRDVPPLSLLVYEKRYMQENQVLALLRSQERQNTGLVEDVDEELTAASRSVLDRVVGPKGAPRRRLKLAGLAAAPIILLLVVFYQKKGTDYIGVLCARCHKLTTLRNKGPWPQRCPDCGAVQAYPAGVCQKCGKVFMVTDPHGRGIRCPVCSSDKWKLYRHEEMAQVKPSKGAAGKTADGEQEP